MTRLKKHLSPATVISCIALFVALSGSVYAAGLAKNSVKAKNIANNAVTSPKIKNGAVTAKKLGSGSVIGSKIANESVGASKLADASVRSNALGGGVVTTAKLKDLAVTEGKLGTNSVTKDKIAANAVETGKLAKEAVSAEKLTAGFYAQLTKNVSYESKTSEKVESENSKFATASCPAGKEAIGGGGRVNGELKEVAITGSYPQVVEGKRTGWTAEARESTETAENWSIDAFVVCAEL